MSFFYSFPLGLEVCSVPFSARVGLEASLLIAMRWSVRSSDFGAEAGTGAWKVCGGISGW